MDTASKTEQFVNGLLEKCPELLEKKIDEPGMVCFRNFTKAAEILARHTIENPNDLKIVHCDVDVDGIASGVVVNRFISAIGQLRNTAFTINNDKEHGITEKYVEWAQRNGVKLFIIVDSGSNDTSVIEKMPCDVLVLDHHVVEHSNTVGKTAGGDYVIINNMLGENLDETEETMRKFDLSTRETSGAGAVNIFDRLEEASAPAQSKHLSFGEITPDMSGCEVTYEFLRMFEEVYKQGNLLEEAKAYQWVGVSLLTDSIRTTNPRNQWYMRNTVEAEELETGLAEIVKALSWKGHAWIDKSFIQFTFAPTINCAIRAGKGLEALQKVLNEPSEISSLRKYREQQLNMLNIVQNTDVEDLGGFALVDLTNIEGVRNYLGVAATKLVEKYNLNIAAYVLVDGKCIGSFRGRASGVDYLAAVNSQMPDEFAQGHDGAFGYGMYHDQLKQAMAIATSAESGQRNKLSLTAGSVPYELRGDEHIEDFERFIKAGKIVELGLINSRVSNREEQIIIVPLRDLEETEPEGARKVWKYKGFGLTMKSFGRLTTEYVSIYPEYSKNLEVYVRNYKLD